MKKIFIQSEGKALGPSSVEEVRSLITAGWLAKTNLAQYEGEDKWQPLSSMPEFNESGPASPVEPSPQPEPPAPAAAPRAPLNIEPLLRTATRALILLILLGLVAFAGLYVARHANEIFKPADANEIRRKAATNTPPAANTANTPSTAATTANPVRQIPVVQLAPAPTNTAPASWERTSQPEVATQSSVAIVTAVTAVTAVTGASNAAPAATMRRCVSSRVDPKSTPFGDYDVAVIKTVQKKWFTLMDENAWLKQRTGRVVIGFQLLQNGSVSNVKVVQSSGDGIQDYLCQQAINDAKPFPRWPATAIGEKDSRDMQFTFQY